jgi:hypothetical protein
LNERLKKYYAQLGLLPFAATLQKTAGEIRQFSFIELNNGIIFYFLPVYGMPP